MVVLEPAKIGHMLTMAKSFGKRAMAANAMVRLSPLARRVRKERLTYLTPQKLLSLESLVQRIDLDKVAGNLVEAGVALGGSAILLASNGVAQQRRFDGYDVFAMIPPPGESDPAAVHARYNTIVAGDSKGIGDDVYYGYRENLRLYVEQKFAEFGVPVGEGIELHEGYFEETLHPTAPVALAHIDCDWHDPVALCLERIYPHLAVGGFIVVDDYYDYEGCRVATDNFVATSGIDVVRTRDHLVLQRSH